MGDVMPSRRCLLPAFGAIKVSSPCGYSGHVPAQMRDPDAFARSWNGLADRRAAFSRTTSAVDLKFLSLLPRVRAGTSNPKTTLES
jgi:hypothetical protein